MLQGFRNLGKSWLGKLIVGVLFGLLILSFAIWGIADVFRGYGVNIVATVGDRDITIDQMRTAYQNELQQLSRRFGRSITSDQARALGLDQQVLGRLIAETALDERASELGLAVSRETVGEAIVKDPAFRNASGQFDRFAFDSLLRANGLTEQLFITEQQAVMARRQLADALTGAIVPPLAMREAVYRYGAERRNIAYVELPASLAGDVGTPEEAALQAFFDERKAAFRAPEYRTVAVLSLRAEDIAKPSEVSDADAMARYEQLKASRFTTPETRKVQQLAFPSQEEANAAREKILAGASLADIAVERGVRPEDIEIGVFTRDQMIDPAVAEAVFALAPGEVSTPVNGRFGIVLVRAAEVTPASVRPFAEVADEIKREIAIERARPLIDETHDRIEDQRIAGKSLAEIAQEFSLNARTVGPLDQNGNGKDGQPVADIPERETLLRSAFETDIGADNEPLRLADGGYLWYDVTNVESARDRTLDEVRADVTAQWRTDEIARRLSDKAQELVTRLDQGATIEAIAAELSLEARTAQGLARGASQDGLPANVVSQVFSVHTGKSASAGIGDGDRRIVFKVTDATVPAFVTSTQEAERLQTQLAAAMRDDILNEYVAGLQGELDVRINQEALRIALGGSGEF